MRVALSDLSKTANEVLALLFEQSLVLFKNEGVDKARVHFEALHAQDKPEDAEPLGAIVGTQADQQLGFVSFEGKLEKELQAPRVNDAVRVRTGSNIDQISLLSECQFVEGVFRDSGIALLSYQQELVPQIHVDV